MVTLYIPCEICAWCGRSWCWAWSSRPRGSPCSEAAVPGWRTPETVALLVQTLSVTARYIKQHMYQHTAPKVVARWPPELQRKKQLKFGLDSSDCDDTACGVKYRLLRFVAFGLQIWRPPGYNFWGLMANPWTTRLQWPRSERQSGNSDSFLGPKKDLLILKIIG